MEDSILNTIKNMLGSETEYDAFDSELIIYINMAFNVLLQLGVGPSSGFSISSASETWGEFISDITKFNMVKAFVYLKVKLMFDPSQNSNITQEYNKQLDELTWRLNVQVESGE